MNINPKIENILQKLTYTLAIVAVLFAIGYPLAQQRYLDAFSSLGIISVSIILGLLTGIRIVRKQLNLDKRLDK